MNEYEINEYEIFLRQAFVLACLHLLCNIGLDKYKFRVIFK